MGMEQQYQEQRQGSSMCLVCGRQGGNTIVVTNVHSFVSASGTPLSDFLVKVVGEDPCYSVSEVICQQCFVLLDRLDAYQARAAEIHSHLTSRYRDTKLELLGQRKRMSELIATSLSNVQELRHGTTLNVSDELTITVVHEAYPKKGKNLYGLENGSLFGHLKTKPESRYNEVKEDAFSRIISQKLKKRKVPQSNSDMGFTSNKRRKLLTKNSVRTSDNNNTTASNKNNNNNNNNISYAKSVKTHLFANQMYISSVNRAAAARRELPNLVREVKDSSDDDEYVSDDVTKDGDDESVSDVDASRDSVEDMPETEKEKDDDDDNEQEEESSDDSSSDSDDDDGSGGEEVEEDEEEDKDSEHVKGEKEEEEETVEAENEEEEEYEEEEEVERLSDADEDECDAQSQRPESSLSQKSKEAASETSVKVKSEVEIKEEPVQSQPTIKEEPANQLQLPSGVSVPPQVAEAMLMQSPLATSLLQSFLATSLWFGSPETPNKGSGQSKFKQEQQFPDDVTREMLAVAAGSTKDKKKRQELKNTGQSYVNTKGKLVNAKRVWPQDCSRCPLKCNARISEDDRQKIFAEYWGLADYNLQREYLAAHMQREEKLGPSGLLRTVILYFLTQGKDKKLQVCRQFFLKTLDVSEKASRIVLEKMVRGELGSDSGATSPLGIIRPLSAQGTAVSSKIKVVGDSHLLKAEIM